MRNSVLVCPLYCRLSCNNVCSHSKPLNWHLNLCCFNHQLTVFKGKRRLATYITALIPLKFRGQSYEKKSPSYLERVMIRNEQYDVSPTVKRSFPKRRHFGLKVTQLFNEPRGETHAMSSVSTVNSTSEWIQKRNNHCREPNWISFLIELVAREVCVPITSGLIAVIQICGTG